MSCRRVFRVPCCTKYDIECAMIQTLKAVSTSTTRRVLGAVVKRPAFSARPLMKVIAYKNPASSDVLQDLNRRRRVAIAGRPGADFVRRALLAKEKSKPLWLRQSQSAGVKVPLSHWKATGELQRTPSPSWLRSTVSRPNHNIPPELPEMDSGAFENQIRKGIVKLKSVVVKALGETCRLNAFRPFDH